MTRKDYKATPDPVLLAIYRTARNTMEREDILALLDEVVNRYTELRWMMDGLEK